MKVMRKIIEIDEEKCTGCGQCVVACAEGAIEIRDGKAKIIRDLLCDGLGACIGECPEDALKIIEREADDFDEKAVHDHLKKMEKQTAQEPCACGCPSSQIQSFAPKASCQVVNEPKAFTGEESALTQWPVQIKLVPPTAPFLKGADLLVVADCVPVAYPSLHKDLLQGRAVMMGCPKFDNAEEYVEKFAQVFAQSGITSVTVALMEVPCCSGLSMIIKKAMDQSGMSIPVNEVVVGVRGKIL
ncbi:MAG: 4Fe-4S binding protein [Proteobacteria bacterium]|nr:4Fe-4S binding protein [Pseudomonadota bacterium]